MSDDLRTKLTEMLEAADEMIDELHYNIDARLREVDTATIESSEIEWLEERLKELRTLHHECLGLE